MHKNINYLLSTEKLHIQVSINLKNFVNFFEINCFLKLMVLNCIVYSSLFELFVHPNLI